MDAIKSYSDSDQRRLSRVFKKSTNLSFQIFGEMAFEKRDATEPQRRKRKNTSLFEVWTVCLAKLSEMDAEKLINGKEQVVNKLNMLLENDNEFLNSVSFATQKRDHVRIRYDRVGKIIQEITNA